VLRYYCKSSDHDVYNFPYRDYIDATCTSLGKTINELINKMVGTMRERIIEYFPCFNHSRENYNEPNSCLRYPKHKVSLYDDFDPFYLVRPTLHDVMSFASLEQASGPSMSLSPDLAPKPNSHRDVTEDVLVSAYPPTPLNHSCDFEDGEEFENASDLDVSITFEVEHHEIDKSEDICLLKSCEEEDEPTNLEYDDDIFFVKNESFSYGFHVNEGLDVDDIVLNMNPFLLTL